MGIFQDRHEVLLHLGKLTGLSCLKHLALVVDVKLLSNL